MIISIFDDLWISLTSNTNATLQIGNLLQPNNIYSWSTPINHRQSPPLEF